MNKISIIVPAYNEGKTLPETIQMVEKADTLGLEKEIILVDDGSTDETKGILKKMENKHKVIYHSKNQGKGAALRDGFDAATGDIILIQDADLENNPKEYPKLLKPILEGRADIVYGSRHLIEKQYSIRYYRYYLGNKVTNWLLNILCGSHMTDFWTGYKVFKREILKDIKLESNRFDIEAELTVKFLNKNYKILEVPIDYFPRSIKEGKKIKARDGLIAIWKIIKYKLYQ